MSILKSFARNEGGNFAVITALALPLMVSAMGGVVEMTNAFRMGTKLQTALDAAALAAGRLPKERLNEASDVAKAYFEANFETSVDIDVQVVNKSRVVVSGTYPVPTTFLKLVHMDVIPVKRSSEVTLSTNTREIALVLDTTGSMAGKKLADMKAAVTRLVTELSEAGREAGVETRFSLVPFTSFVNVRTANGSIPDFVDRQGQANPILSEFPTGFSRLDLYAHLGETWRGCIESRPNGLDVTDTPHDPRRPETMFVPAFAVDEPDPRTSWGFTLAPHYPNDYLSDNGGSSYMFSLSNNFVYHGRNAQTGTLLGNALAAGASANRGAFNPSYHPLSRYGVRFDANGRVLPKNSWQKVSRKRLYRFYSNQTDDQGPNFGCETAPIIPLTQDARVIIDAVKSLEAAGATNIPEGMAWGWRTLAPAGPYTEGRGYDDLDNDKIVVLLTDGANDITYMTNSAYEKGTAYSSFSYLFDGILKRRNGQVARTRADMGEAMDDRVLQVCSNAKDRNVRIFTILLEVNHAATSSMLERCASSKDQFYDARESGRLDDIFEDIRGKISRLRISR